MVGRKKGSFVWTLERAKILSLIKKYPKTISELSREMGLGRTTIYHHLNILKKYNLIIEDKSLKKQGQPVLIATNKAQPLPETFLNSLLNLGYKVKKVEKKRKHRC